MYKKRFICPRCDTKMKVAEDDDDLFYCPNCNLVLDRDEYNAGPPYGFEKEDDTDGDDWMGKDDIDWDDVFDE